MQITCQHDLDCLITCPKIVLSPPRREFQLVNGHFRNDARLKAKDDDLEFGMFMRINAAYCEFFSIGLYYEAPPPIGTVTLLRCNSMHGQHTDNLIDPDPHFAFHVHRADFEMLSNGEDAEKHAVCTTEFACYEEALQYFLYVARVVDADIDRYFAGKRQLRLFELGEP